MLDRQVVLLRIRAAEVRSNTDHSAGRALGGFEVNGRRIGEAVTHARTDEIVAGNNAVDRAKRHMPEEPQERAAVTVGVIEQPEAAADHGVSRGLISKTEARRPVREVAVDPGASVYTIASGKQNGCRAGVEIADSVRHFDIRAIVFPTQTKIECESA